MRKVDAPAHDRGAGDDYLRHGLDRRPRRQRGGARRARHRHGVPELRALPAHERLRQHGLRPAQPRRGQGRDREARRRGGAYARHRHLPEAQAARTVRRPAPARRHGPGDRARAAGVPVRRAPVEPRRQAARDDAHRDPQAAQPPQGHLDLRHARPGRGHDAGRHGRGDERGPRGAGRRADRRLSQPRLKVRRDLHRLARHEPDPGHHRRTRRRHDACRSHPLRCERVPRERRSEGGDRHPPGGYPLRR